MSFCCSAAAQLLASSTSGAIAHTQRRRVDIRIVLVLLLTVGGVIGGQFGTRAAIHLRAERLRILLALLVLAVCGKMALDLVLPPADLYSIAG